MYNNCPLLLTCSQKVLTNTEAAAWLRRTGIVRKSNETSNVKELNYLFDLVDFNITAS